VLLKVLVSCLFIFIFSLSIINYFGSSAHLLCCIYGCIKHIINVDRVCLDFVVIYMDFFVLCSC
jgi:hypothetical protein